MPLLAIDKERRAIGSERERGRERKEEEQISPRDGNFCHKREREDRQESEERSEREKEQEREREDEERELLTMEKISVARGKEREERSSRRNSMTP